MLILSRKVNEAVTLVIPPSTETRTVEVMVTEIGRVVTRLGIEAPREIQVFRNELLLPLSETETPHDAGLTKAV